MQCRIRDGAEVVLAQIAAHVLVREPGIEPLTPVQVLAPPPLSNCVREGGMHNQLTRE
jgi:hypothetical protein